MNALPVDRGAPTGDAAPATHRRTRRLSALAWLFRVALGAIFLVAAVPKIADPEGFAWSIAHYHLLPDSAINLVALFLPWLELLSGLALILGLGVRPNLLIVIALLSLFIAAIGSAMVRQLDISCGCFGTDSSSAGPMTRWTLYWDIVWLLMAIFAFAFDRGYLSLTSVLGWLRRRDRFR